MLQKIEFKVEKNEKYGDYRVVKYVDGKLSWERDDNWTEAEANVRCKQHIDAYIYMGYKM